MNLLRASLLAIAEETLAEFLSKATGTAVDWVQMIGMKVCSLKSLVFPLKRARKCADVIVLGL